ncbi:unnamed protein product [Closterium sp. Naga37s-1]|nr:unnamed protein product [Closterium sp. Naga37s-1]
MASASASSSSSASSTISSSGGTSASASSSLAAGLARKLRKVLDTRTDSPELLAALGALSGFYRENSLANRRALKSTIERRGLAINEEFLQASEAAQEALDVVEAEVRGLAECCDRIGAALTTCASTTGDMVLATERLKLELVTTVRRQQLVAAFLRSYQLSPQEVQALREDEISEKFFEALNRVHEIHANCKLLLRTHHQRAGLELMDLMAVYQEGAYERAGLELMDLMAVYQEGAYERLCRWVQAECRSLGDSDGDTPEVGPLLRTAAHCLKDRPVLFRYCTEEVANTRHNALFHRFIAALTRGRPGGMPRPIEVHAHDPLRYVGDMLAWLHQALASEKELAAALFANTDKPSSTSAESGEGGARAGGVDADVAAVLDRVFEGVCRPFKVRVEQVLTGQPGLVLCYKLSSLLSFYCHTVAELLGEKAALCVVLRDLSEAAGRAFLDAVKLRGDRVLRFPPAVPSDLSPPPLVGEGVAVVLELLQAHASMMVPAGAGKPDFLPVAAALLDPLVEVSSCLSLLFRSHHFPSPLPPLVGEGVAVVLELLQAHTSMMVPAGAAKPDFLPVTAAFPDPLVKVHTRAAQARTPKAVTALTSGSFLLSPSPRVCLCVPQALTAKAVTALSSGSSSLPRRASASASMSAAAGGDSGPLGRRGSVPVGRRSTEGQDDGTDNTVSVCDSASASMSTAAGGDSGPLGRRGSVPVGRRSTEGQDVGAENTQVGRVGRWGIRGSLPLGRWATEGKNKGAERMVSVSMSTERVENRVPAAGREIGPLGRRGSLPLGRQATDGEIEGAESTECSSQSTSQPWCPSRWRLSSTTACSPPSSLPPHLYPPTTTPPPPTYIRRWQWHATSSSPTARQPCMRPSPPASAVNTIRARTLSPLTTCTSPTPSPHQAVSVARHIFLANCLAALHAPLAPFPVLTPYSQGLAGALSEHVTAMVQLEVAAILDHCMLSPILRLIAQINQASQQQQQQQQQQEGAEVSAAGAATPPSQQYPPLAQFPEASPSAVAESLQRLFALLAGAEGRLPEFEALGVAKLRAQAAGLVAGALADAYAAVYDADCLTLGHRSAARWVNVCSAGGWAVGLFGCMVLGGAKLRAQAAGLVVGALADAYVAVYEAVWDEHMQIPVLAALGKAWGRTFANCSQATGLTCNGKGMVIEMSLNNTQLTGSIPSVIGKLSLLAHVNLGANQLTGVIPESIGNLTNLSYLGLYNNQLTGPVPQSIAALAKLQTLTLSDNRLNGNLPNALGNLTALLRLNLDNNLLSGSLPSTLSALSSATYLSISDNLLNGTLPDGIGALSALQSLGLANNSLSGPLPISIGNLTSLVTLGLTNNSLSGRLPSSISSLGKLEKLNLGFNIFTGALPNSIRRMTALTRIRLHNTSLSGPLPPRIGELRRLKQVDLSNTGISGALPESMGHLDKLTELYMHGCQLNGSLPVLLGNLTALQTLDLGSNHFSGEIPLFLSSLTRVESLDLSANQLTGLIPDTVSTMQRLQQLDLASNSLSGSVPSTTALLTNLTSLNLSHNNLSGTIPASFSTLTGLQALDLSYNPQLSGSIPATLGQLSNLTFLATNGTSTTCPLPSAPCEVTQSSTSAFCVACPDFCSSCCTSCSSDPCTSYPSNPCGPGDCIPSSPPLLLLSSSSPPNPVSASTNKAPPPASTTAPNSSYTCRCSAGAAAAVGANGLPTCVTSPPPPPQGPSSAVAMPTGAIIGIAVASFAVIVCCFTLIFLCWRWRHTSQSRELANQGWQAEADRTHHAPPTPNAPPLPHPLLSVYSRNSSLRSRPRRRDSMPRCRHTPSSQSLPHPSPPHPLPYPPPSPPPAPPAPTSSSTHCPCAAPSPLKIAAAPTLVPCPLTTPLRHPLQSSACFRAQACSAQQQSGAAQQQGGAAQPGSMLAGFEYPEHVCGAAWRDEYAQLHARIRAASRDAWRARQPPGILLVAADGGAERVVMRS